MNEGRKLIVLNDGTDEIFNLHYFDDLKCKERFYFQWAMLFLDVEVIQDMLTEGMKGYEESLKRNEPRTPEHAKLIYHTFYWLVDIDAESKRFIVTDEPIESIEARLKLNNEDSEYGYGEEAFSLSWLEVRKILGWSK